jgi:hypothetical protein
MFGLPRTDQLLAQCEGLWGVVLPLLGDLPMGTRSIPCSARSATWPPSASSSGRWGVGIGKTRLASGCFRSIEMIVLASQER